MQRLVSTIMCSLGVVLAGADVHGSPIDPLHRTASPPADPADALVLLGRLDRADITALNVPIGRPEAFSVPVTIDGVERVLVLERDAVWTADTRVLVERPDGGFDEIPPPPANTYRGSIVGMPDATVLAALGRHGLRATVELPGGDDWEVEPLAGMGLHAIFRANDLRRPTMSCGVPVDPDAGAGGVPPAEPAMPGAPEGIGGSTHVAQLLVECDYDFFDEAGGPLDALEEMGTAVHRINEPFERDVDITHVISAIIVRTGEPDPYTTADAGVLIDQFIAQLTTYPGEWFDLAMLFTGKDLFNSDGNSIAGLAQLGRVCVGSAGGGAGIAERFTSASTQATLVAHELGHIWNAHHCNTGTSCAGHESPCNIMCSTLNGCDGDFAFGPCAVSSIIAHRDSRSCLEPGTNGVQYVAWRPCGFGCPENGDIDAPHNTLAEAAAESATGGTIILLTGSSSLAGGDEAFPLVIDTAVTLRALQGGAVIGQ